MTTHHFQPDHYYTAIGTYEPVLHLDSGDCVVTTTVDASGRDAAGEQVSAPGNPMTGPFFIQGAEPGDTLALHLDRITPNRSMGYTSQSLAPHIVEPAYVPSLYQRPKDEPWEPALWEIDTAAGTATLQSPETKLGRFSLPLDPMLGCFGVAPDRGQSISTATAGPYGGNMDYRGFKAGTIVYLPVFVPGGLLFVGDGHAVQGDGEVAGTGIEVSMEVQFRVELIKNKRIHWPRGENGDYIFTAGNARPLDQALQHATTEMIRWLEEDHGLDGLSAGLLIGQVVEYEVGNVFDPAYTMVCKIPKAILARLGEVVSNATQPARA
jgi:acetamidase/formamidase